MGVRERKRLAAREALAEAAMSLAIEHGFERLHVEDIARAAGVSPRTFNNYFSSKEEAIVSVAFARASRLRERLSDRPATEDLWEALGNAFAALYPVDADWQDQAQLIRATPLLAAEQLKAYAAIERDLAEVIAGRDGVGESADDLRPRLAAACATATVRVVIDYFLDVGFDDTFVATLKDALVRAGGGLTTRATTRKARS